MDKAAQKKRNEYLKMWYELGFDEAAIALAEEITKRKTGENDIDFTDGTLRYWYSKGLFSATEILEGRKERPVKWEYKYAYLCHRWCGEFFNDSNKRFINIRAADLDKKAEEIEKILNQYGKEGWELVSISDDFLSDTDSVDGFALFKRPVMD